MAICIIPLSLPHPQWADANESVSMDPWGHLIANTFAAEIASGADVLPTIANTKAHIYMPALKDAIAVGVFLTGPVSST